MKKNINSQKLLSYLFSLGLLFLMFNFVAGFIQNWLGANSTLLNSVPFAVIGLVVCLVTFPFLLIEWLMLPSGTYSKRISFYQGAGNVIALTIMLGVWFWQKDHAAQNLEIATLTISSGGLVVAIACAWLGGQIASFIAERSGDFEFFDNLKAQTAVRNAAVKISAKENDPAVASLRNSVSST